MPFLLDADPSQAELAEAVNYVMANLGQGGGGTSFVNPDNSVGDKEVTMTSTNAQWLYRYLDIRFADSSAGANFRDTWANATYVGLHNDDSPTESTNPADYVWQQYTDFGAALNLYYLNSGGRRIQFFQAASNPGTGWQLVPQTGTAIDLDSIAGTAGANGTSSYPLAIYTLTNTTTSPSTPSGGSFDIATGTLTAPSSWFVAYQTPAAGQYAWQSTSAIRTQATTGTVTPTWNTPVQVNFQPAVPTVSQNATSGVITVTSGATSATINPTYVGSVDASQRAFLQGTNGQWSGTQTITATFAVPGFASTSTSVTASFTVAANGNITGTVPTPNAAIAVTFVGNNSQTVGVEFDHTSGAAIGASAVAQTTPQYATNAGVATVSVGAVTVATLPSPLQSNFTYPSGQAYTQAPNNGDWTPTPVSNAIQQVVNVEFRRAGTAVGSDTVTLSYNTTTGAWTRTGSGTTPTTITYGASTSSSSQFKQAVTYTDSNGTLTENIQIDVIQGGARGAPGPANVVRYGRFASNAAALTTGAPTDADGVDNVNWFRSPSVFPAADPYTHVTSQFVNDVVAGTPYQSVLTFSGQGGGEYLPGLNEIYTETIAAGHTASTVTNEQTQFAVTGNSGDVFIPTTTPLYGITWDGTQFVATGQSGVILTSSNGITWTLRTSNTTEIIYSIVWSGSLFVAAGNSGATRTSTDGITWVTRTAQSFGVLDAAWSGSLFCLVGGVGGISTSPDGVVWTTRTSGTINSLNGVVWANNQFVVVGNNGTVLTSSDGITWTARTSSTSNTLNKIAWSGSTLVAVGASGTVITSGDAITWTTRTSGTTNQLNGVNWGNSLFVMSGNSGTIRTSPDGTTWTGRTSGTSANLYDSVWSGSQFVLTSNDGIVIRSTTGTTWTRLLNNNIAISIPYYTSAGLPETTFSANISLSANLSTQAALGADFVSKVNALSTKPTQLTFSLNASNNVQVDYNVIGNASPATFTVTQSSGGTTASTISIGTQTTINGSPSSLQFNNVAVATNRAQLQITGAPTILANGQYVWPITILAANGIVPTNVIIDVQTTLQSAVTEFSSTNFYTTQSASSTTPSLSGTQFAYKANFWWLQGYSWNASELVSSTTGSISLIPANFGSAQAALQALTTGNYIFVQGTDTTTSTMTILFSSGADNVQQALDICTAFNTSEVAYTASCVSNVVTLTSSQQINRTDIAHGTLSQGSNGNIVIGDFSLVKTQDGRAAYSVGSGSPSTVTLTKAGNFGAGSVKLQGFGTNWLQNYISPTFGSFFFDIIWSGSLFVAGGTAGLIATSTDGVSWSTTTLTGNDVGGIVWNGSLYVAVGGTGTIFTSTTGTGGWTTRSSGVSTYLAGIAWSGSLFCVVGAGGTILTSPDGITWTKRTSSIISFLRNVVWGNGRFVAVGDSGSVIWSTDGVTWNVGASGTTSNIVDVTWTGTRFAAVISPNILLLSNDGASWSSGTTGSFTFSNLTGVSTINGLICVVGGTGNSTIISSPDGVTWTQRYFNDVGSEIIYALAANDTTICAVGVNVPSGGIYANIISTTNGLDYGIPAVGPNPSGSTPSFLSLLQDALARLNYITVAPSTSTLRIYDVDTTAGGTLSIAINNGANPTGTLAISQQVVDMGTVEVVNGDPNRWSLPANVGRQVT